MELPGYIFIPDEIASDVLSRGAPILARSGVGEEWWVVYRDGDHLDTMPEYEWARPPVMRLWDGEKIEHATAE